MRLYKFEITGYPTESLDRIEYEDGIRTGYSNAGWKPEGWKEYLDEAAGDGSIWAKNAIADGYRFFWPSTRNIYRSRSSAADKVAIVERWGGVAQVLEAEVSPFIPVEEANALRKRRRDNVRIAKLQEQIKAIEDAAA